MRALIGPDLIRKLIARDVEIRDTKLTGFQIRCRASGVHTYRYEIGRGRRVTLGRVGKVSPEVARAAAEAQRSMLSAGTLDLMAKDDSLHARDARARVRERLRAKRGQRRLTWAALVDEYERLATGDMKSAKETLRRMRMTFGPWFNETKLEDITVFEIERWRASRRKERASASTINRDLDVLRAALNWAVATGLLTVNPAAGIKRAKADRNAPVRFLAADEESRLRKALDARDERRRAERESANAWRREREYEQLPALGAYTDHLTPMTLLALNTGARRGELFNLRWQDIDGTRRLMTLQGGGTKNHQTRHIALNSEARSVLKAWKRDGAKPTDYVFPGEDGARLVTIKSAWLRVVKAAKLPRFRFHDCRHCFGSKLVQAGEPLAVVRELLGHSDIKITTRYAHLAPEHRAAAVEKLVRA